MPALIAKRSSSGLCAIRRELRQRRKLAAAPKGGIAKKSSAQQSSACASIQKKPSAHEPAAGPATTKPPSMPTPRPRAGDAMPSASILQHAPAGVATKKQLAVVAKGDGGAANSKEIATVPMAQIAKRCTAPPRRSALSPTASTMKVSTGKASAGVPNKSTPPPPPRRSAPIQPASGGAYSTELSAATTGAGYIKKGMAVKVRTRAGILPTGHCLVLWLGARVVSDAAADDDGYVEVIYDGNFPRDDPLRTVRVAMDDVKSMPAIVES
ncbi:hypothetical protein ZWY2020_018608 [Hordeum vulgare]|nr:hypothetical protein ZWY2020_018608 [Hordeum vulgare]